jgi:hypothetical protein
LPSRFDPLESERIWIEFDATIKGAASIVTDDRGRQALDQMRKTKGDCLERIKPLLGPETPEDARKAADLLLSTRRELLESLDRL